MGTLEYSTDAPTVQLFKAGLLTAVAPLIQSVDDGSLPQVVVVVAAQAHETKKQPVFRTSFTNGGIRTPLRTEFMCAAIMDVFPAAVGIMLATTYQGNDMHREIKVLRDRATKDSFWVFGLSNKAEVQSHGGSQAAVIQGLSVILSDDLFSLNALLRFDKCTELATCFEQYSVGM